MINNTENIKPLIWLAICITLAAPHIPMEFAIPFAFATALIALFIRTN